MNTTRHPLQFSVVTVLAIFLLVALTMFGGALGVASGLQETITELSPANRQFALISGLICGLIPVTIIGAVIHFAFRKPIVTFALSAFVAILAPTVVLYFVTAMIAAA